MARRTGFPKAVITWMPWGSGHAVLRTILEGTGWFEAWAYQACTPLDRITRKTGIAQARILAFARGGLPTPEEVEALSLLWNVQPRT